MDFIELTRVLVWPCLILLLGVLFRKPLTSLMTPGSGQTSLEVGPQGLKIQKIAATVAAVAANTAASASLEYPIDANALAANLTSGIEASLRHPNAGPAKSILWVDDTPSNNKYLVDAFRDLGIEVTLAESTREAGAKLDRSMFDLVISDMSRPPEQEAGLDLVKVIKAKGIKSPVIIFAAYWARKHKGKEADFGVDLITNDSSQVYSTVLKNLLANKRE